MTKYIIFMIVFNLFRPSMVNYVHIDSDEGEIKN